MMESTEKSPRVLVLSMAFNGYQYLFRKNIETHRRYAARHGYGYVFIHRPYLTRMLMECAWLKIPLLLCACAKGYDYVLFLDADAAFQPKCPAILSVVEEEKSVYMVNGHSGRLNSGMIFLRCCPETIGLLTAILAHFDRKLPDEDSVGWGENGHVIHFVKQHPSLKLLPIEWNNTKDTERADYIRHYSDGKMRAIYGWNAGERLLANLLRIAQKLVRRVAQLFFRAERFPGALYSLLRRCVRYEPESLVLLNEEALFAGRGR